MYLLLGAITTLAFLFVPGLRIGVVLNLIALSSPIVILVALRMNRVEYKLPWILIALGQVFFVAGDVITYNYDRLFMQELPFPRSATSCTWRSTHACWGAAPADPAANPRPGPRQRDRLDDRRGRGGVLSWVFLIAPYTHDSSLTSLQKLVSMGYPLVDLMLITGAIRLVVGGGRKNAAFYCCSPPWSPCS